MKGRGSRPLWMPRGLSHYKIIVVCYVSGAKSLREFVFCVSTRTQRKKKSKDYQEFIEECKTSHMERRFTQQGLQPMCEAGCLHGEKQNNAARPLPCSRSAPPPHSIDMHSWPGRCKNRPAVPELEMVTECGLQLLGFWVLSDTSKPSRRWGELARDMSKSWAVGSRRMDWSC